jgi:hypothetical protein
MYDPKILDQVEQDATSVAVVCVVPENNLLVQSMHKFGDSAVQAWEISVIG